MSLTANEIDLLREYIETKLVFGKRYSEVAKSVSLLTDEQVRDTLAKFLANRAIDAQINALRSQKVLV